MPSASVKDYASLVKKISEAGESERPDLAKQKRVVADELIAKCKNKAERRKLKFTMDDINNS